MPSSEYVIQIWVLLSFGKAAPLVAYCVGWLWGGGGRGVCSKHHQDGE